VDQETRFLVNVIVIPTLIGMAVVAVSCLSYILADFFQRREKHVESRGSLPQQGNDPRA